MQAASRLAGQTKLVNQKLEYSISTNGRGMHNFLFNREGYFDSRILPYEEVIFWAKPLNRKGIRKCR